MAIFKMMSKDEQCEFIWGDTQISDIGLFPTGEYTATVLSTNWAEPVFLDGNLIVDMIGMNTGISGIYSKNGIYVGCRDFDCDRIAWFTFFRKSRVRNYKMKPFAEYKNPSWELKIDDTCLQEAYPLFWYNGSLFCRGIKHGDDWHAPIFIKLTITKEKRGRMIHVR